MRRWLPWALGLLVVVVALAIGTSSSGGAQTPTDKAASIEKGVRCPTCRELSVAESDARAAQAIRTENEGDAFVELNVEPGSLRRTWVQPVGLNC